MLKKLIQKVMFAVCGQSMKSVQYIHGPLFAVLSLASGNKIDKPLNR